MWMMTPGDTSFRKISLQDLLGRPLNDIEQKNAPEALYIKGKIELPLPGPRVSIVGSRKASLNGLADSRMITNELVTNNVLIVSGLAEGIDTSAHTSAIKKGGQTVAVLGTPLDKSFPAKNFELQQKMMREYMAISQFEVDEAVKPKNFVIRNRTMALISDATIIVEASDRSGSLHQGWEAIRLGRPLFIWKSILNHKVTWHKKMIEYGALVLENPTDVLEVLPTSSPIEEIQLLS
jgi:DNA processing protein